MQHKTTQPKTIELKNQKDYITELKDCIFDEILKRIEKNMDENAVDILQKAKQNVRWVAIALKPICLLFLFSAHQATQVNI